MSFPPEPPPGVPGALALRSPRLVTANEADDYLPFLTDALELPAGGSVLELGCGRGSVLVRLAEWGYRATGVDDSAAMLELARAAAARRGVDLDLRLQGIPDLTERGVFDGALALDFGTYSDADNASVIRTVADALKPGGRLVFGTCNPYYWAREPRTEHRSIEGTDVIRTFSFDFMTGCVASRVRCILPSGERKAFPPAHYRAYTVPELRTLTSNAGLADLRIYGEDEGGRPRPDRPLDTLRTPFFHCVALRPVRGEAGEGI